MPERYIFWIEELGQEHCEIVGKKCGNLGEMAKIGLLVPPGFALSVEAYKDFMIQTNARREIQNYLSQVSGDIETIDGLPPKEAIKEGRVKDTPYVVNGKTYVPMSVEKAENYRERGIASWYGYETSNKPGGHMTANGEAFDPNGLNAAHKYLPLPTHVKVTNLENGRSILLRVNDRGPFVEGRIIDLSAGAAKRLGFYEKGTARVLVETIPVEG